MKIRLVAAELFPADGQIHGRADMIKVTIAFRYFANAPENNN